MSNTKIEESFLPFDKKLLLGELSYRGVNENSSLKLPPKSIRNSNRLSNNSFLR
jgi:hypothetical protein